MQHISKLNRQLQRACIYFASIIYVAPSHAEIQFSSHPITNPVIAVAYPILGTEGYQLQIYEQKPRGRRCWAEESDGSCLIRSKLLEFDFKGSCARYIDLNGYSIRIGNNQMAIVYRPVIQRVGVNLCLVAVPAKSTKENPKILIGTGKLGRVGRVQKIVLDKSWQITRRMFQGRPLGHVYIESVASIASTQSLNCNK